MIYRNLILCALALSAGHLARAGNADNSFGGDCITRPKAELDSCLAEWARKKYGPIQPTADDLKLDQLGECFENLRRQPAIIELMTTLGVNAPPQEPLTPAQAFNDGHASAKDSGAALAWIAGSRACSALGPVVSRTPESLAAADRMERLWRGFAYGGLTYGEMSMILKKQIRELMAAPMPDPKKIPLQ